MAIVGTGALNLGIYNDYFVRTFEDSPAALMSALSNNPQASTMSSATGQVLDHILNDCVTAGLIFWNVANLGHPGGFVIAPLVWAVGLVVTGYTAFLVILSKLFVSAILAVGPLFIFAYLFESTKNYFASFLNNLVQYGLVGVLAMLSCESILGIFQHAAQDEVARGGALQIVDLASMFITGFISIMLLLQVQSVAASLAGGVALDTFGAGRKTHRAATDGAKYIAGKSYNATKRLFRKSNEIKQASTNRENRQPRKEMPRRTPIRTGTSD